MLEASLRVLDEWQSEESLLDCQSSIVRLVNITAPDFGCIHHDPKADGSQE